MGVGHPLQTNSQQTMKTTNTLDRHVLELAEDLCSKVRQLIGARNASCSDQILSLVDAFYADLNSLNNAEHFELRSFLPQNGHAAVERVNKDQNVWRVLAIAKNWPLAHHPLQPGQHIIPAVEPYRSGQGTIAWVTPKEILAIAPDPAPVVHRSSIR